MSSIKKYVTNIDRCKNSSTSPSAIKVKLKDLKTGQIVNAVVRNDDFALFLQNEQGLDREQYVNYMVNNESKPLEINMANFKRFLEKKWLSKPLQGEKYFNEHVVFEAPMTFEQLKVSNEKELLSKYFDFDYTKGLGFLKQEYYEKYTRNPMFISLLINLGYDVTWGCIAPVLTISIAPSLKE